MNSRQVAFNLIQKLFKNHAYSNILLDSELKKYALSDADKAFVTALFYGVIEKQIFIDYQLSCVLRQPLKKLRPEVLTALRMGVYQIFFMKKIPESAAVNESVKLVKKNKCAYAAGLVNAALRNVIKNGIKLPEENEKNYLSVKYSVPDNLINLWLDSYGEENTLAILSSLDEKPKTVIRVNTLLTNTDDLFKKLVSQSVSVYKNDLLENSLVIEKSGAISEIEAFKDGLFHVEDTAAQKAALLLDAKEGERVLDVCSAPGGKAFTVAEQMRSGEIVACDLYEQRVKLIERGALRLKIPFIKAIQNDATLFNENLGLFDKVLCDVPCSGLGIIRRKPEIRYKSDEEIKNSSALQYKILETSFKYLKSGGTLVYSTCTLNPAENEDVVTRFINESGAKLLSQKTFFPHTDGTDGFYAAVIAKNE